MATCTLEVGERVVLLSREGPPEAEYALFDAGDIILSSTGPGQVREVGYHALAVDALGRLASLGVDLRLAREAAEAIAPSLAATYARGSAVRRVTPQLGPAELFDGGTYDNELRRYEGRWLDLPALALDVEITRATTLMQAFSLVARLHEVDPQTSVVLTTREYAAERRPGERSYRRVALDLAANLPHAFRTLAERRAAEKRQTARPERAQGPTREELVLALHERREACPNPEARQRIIAIEGAMKPSPRARPQRGPLSDEELWALEEQLSTGSAVGVFDHLESIEKRSGRSPATSYLRGRASLLLGREPARTIAERAGALAMSMTAFAECELLAAEAWLAAGEVRRAMPFARNLVESANVHEDLRARAAKILDAVDPSRGPAPPVPSTLPPPAPDSSDPVIFLGQRSISDELRIHVDQPFSSLPPSPLHSSPPRGVFEPEIGKSLPSSAAPRLAVEQLDAKEEPPSSPIALIATPRPPRSGAPGKAELSSPPRTSVREGPMPSFLPTSRRAHEGTPNLMRGGSQPPFRSDSPGAHAHIPKAPRSPVGAEGELVATLALPPGLTGLQAPQGTLPGSVLDARVQFTYLSRELAREYEEDLGIVLRVDLASLEAMQAELLERFPDRVVTTAGQALDVQKHGALLSEILARSFRAFWVDIAPSELGYWAMVVPPETRVWPFGRILRFIAMQHKERDLVAYYLELAARAQ